MRPLGSRELLSVWEWGEERHPVDRALALLGAACPERSPDELAVLSLGRRDALLLELRRRTFGSRLEGVAPCPGCGERIELGCEVEGLLADVPAEESPIGVESGGYEVAGRPLTSLDLAAVAACDEVDAGRRELLRRSVVSARRNGAEVPAEELPESVVAAFADAVEERDPLCWIELDVRCPACGQDQPLSLDVVSFLWAEVAAEARRLLAEVHVLARAYGWREDDVLALPPRRRRFYLERVS